MTGRLHLRFVEKPWPERQPRLEVAIFAHSSRGPHCRSRMFWLSPRALDELIAVALRLEARG